MVVRIGMMMAAFATAVLLGGCDVISTSPAPEYLNYTEESVNLADEIERIRERPGTIDYTLDVVYTSRNEPRVLLLVEPPAGEGSDFDYDGELLLFDRDLEQIASTTPGRELDTFGRPFSYAHDGNILVSNSILGPGGSYLDSLTYQGLDGPVFVDPSPDPARSYVFSLSPGDFAGFTLRWVEYGPPPIPYPVTSQGEMAIIPEAKQPDQGTGGYDDLGFQLLDAVYNDDSDEVTFLFSEPSRERVYAARVVLEEIRSGERSSLADGRGAFAVAVDTDRPLDAHADRSGFFLRRRDGWLERYRWNAAGELSQKGSVQRIVGDRYFDRNYAFLSGVEANEPAMYRFDPSSQILTRYGKWW